MSNIRGIIGVGLMFVCSAVLFAGCNHGGTDGESSTAELAAHSYVYVSNGGAGGRITLELTATRLFTGQEAGFFVILEDPNGAPLKFEPVTCLAEFNIGIGEPSYSSVDSAVNVASAKTNQDGRMSGRIFGRQDGSGILECMAQNIPGLKVSQEIVVDGGSQGTNIAFINERAGSVLGGGTVGTRANPNQGTGSTTVSGPNQKSSAAADTGVLTKCVENFIAISNNSGKAVNISNVDANVTNITLGNSATTVLSASKASGSTFNGTPFTINCKK